jgi:hypothetical protein
VGSDWFPAEILCSAGRKQHRSLYKKGVMRGELVYWLEVGKHSAQVKRSIPAVGREEGREAKLCVRSR